MHYVDVVLPLPLDGLFTYSVPEEMAGGVCLGVRLLVPFGKSKTYTAMAVRMHDEKPDFEVKAILAVIDDTPVLPERQFRLWQWISEYYMAPLGDVFKAALPSGLKAEDGYRPKTERYVALADNLRSERALRVAYDLFRTCHAPA